MRLWGHAKVCLQTFFYHSMPPQPKAVVTVAPRTRSSRGPPFTQPKKQIFLEIPSVGSLQTMSISQIRNLCRNQGISSQGSKTDLIDRLSTSHDVDTTYATSILNENRSEDNFSSIISPDIVMPLKSKEDLSKSHVAIANEADDTFNFLRPPVTLVSNDEEIAVDFYSTSTLSDSLKSWVFDLFKKNMYTLYVNSNDGYNQREKYAEMFADTSRFMIARKKSEPQELLGFLNFRFMLEETIDDGLFVEVAYCFDIQLTESSRSKGLGTFLMNLLEQVGREWKMEKIMLTVFKTNERAFLFYKEKLGFEIDEISPSSCLDLRRARRFDYEILSKKL